MIAFSPALDHQSRAWRRVGWFLLFLAAFTAQSQSYWPQFRGPTGRGVAEAAQPPVSFAKGDALWTSEVPSGHSSPCIWGDKIFLTTFADGQLACRAYHRRNGVLAWIKPLTLERVEATHPFSNPAAPTPAADSAHVIFYVGSYGLLAYTHEGELVWEKKLPPPVSRGNYGSASSPVLWRDLVILAVDTDEGGSRLLAFRRATGDQVWETPRPLFAAGWSTPVVWTRRGKSELVLLGSKKLVAYEPTDGRELWSVPGFPLETVPSPAFDEDHLFAGSAGLGGRSNPNFEGFAWADLLQFDANHDGRIQAGEVPESYRLLQRPELPEGHPGRMLPFPVRGMLSGMDKDKDEAVTREEWSTALGEFEKMDAPVVIALRPGETNGPTTEVTWRHSRGIPEVPSPLCYEGKLFLVKDGGMLQCLDTRSGSVVYQERLGVAGGYAASPVGADGRVYLASQSGTITVIDARASRLSVLARNPLGETITATPAMVEDQIYVRTEKHLLAFGGQPKPSASSGAGE